MVGSQLFETGGWTRALYALACVALVSMPFLVVKIPPITDLAQQLAQIPLALDTLSGEAPEYRIQWLSPNKLSYPLLGISWALFEPFGAATMAMILVGAVWVGACAWLAAKRNRPIEGAVLSTLFFFNQSTYMGFLNFAVGMAAFMFWVQVVGGPEDDDRDARTIFVGALVGGLLLYYTHVLWFGMACLWLGAHWLLSRPRKKVLFATAAGLLPTVLLAATWYPSLARQGWAGGQTKYGALPWQRLFARDWIFDWLGGVNGRLEPVTLGLLLVWLVVALWQHRGQLSEVVDKRLLLVAVILILAALLLPRKVHRTLLLARRWMPAAAVFLVLALPKPKLGPLVSRLLVLLLVASFALVTSSIWILSEKEELQGLHECLERLPEEPRLLGLDFLRDSPRIRMPPYFQLTAYGQLLRGGRLGFSFVSLASSMVVRRDMQTGDPWTRGLEWYPREVRVSDLDHFDYVLVHSVDSTQTVLERKDPRLEPITEPAPWRLFKVEHESR